MKNHYIKTKQRLETVATYINFVYAYNEPILQPTSRGVSSYMPR